MDIAREIEQALSNSHQIQIELIDATDPDGNSLVMSGAYANRADLVRALAGFLLSKSNMRVTHYHICICNNVVNP